MRRREEETDGGIAIVLETKMNVLDEDLDVAEKFGREFRRDRV